jgi:hypothetical protein
MKGVRHRLIGLFLALVVILVLPGAHLYAQQTRGTVLPPGGLPQELKGTAVKDYYVPSSLKKVGVIHSLEGAVAVEHKAPNEAYLGRAGAVLYEGDSLYTMAESRCRAKFFSEDVITMAADTQFSVDSYDDQRKEGKKNSTFSLAKGRAMFYALRLFQYKETKFMLNTPTVTVGVRGTKFGAEVLRSRGEKTADAGVQVADTGNEVGPYLAQLPPGGVGQIITNVFSEDGFLDVNGLLVGPGQAFLGAFQQIVPIPPDLLRSFVQALGGKPPEGGTGAEVPAGGDTGEVDLAQLIEQLLGLIAQITQTQTATKTEGPTSTEIVPYTGSLKGYFALLLHKNYGFRDAFLNWGTFPLSPGLVHDDTDLQGNGTIYGGDSVKFTSSGTDTATIGGSTANILQNVDGVEHYVGQNAYAQWGYWEADAPTSFTIIGGTDPGAYSFVGDKAWFVEAKHITTSTEIAAIPAGDYAYSGVARGTYYNGSSSADMSGSFGCTVHFGSASVKDFNLSVSGGGHTAQLVQTGAAASINSSSSGNGFNISIFSTATIDSTSVSSHQVVGSLVGDAGQGIIGAYGLGCSSTGVGVSGVFSGTGGPP